MLENLDEDRCKPEILTLVEMSAFITHSLFTASHQPQLIKGIADTFLEGPQKV